MLKKLLEMTRKQQLALIAGSLALVLSSVLAIATTNTVVLPRTTADQRNFTVTPDGLKPEQCSTISVSVVKSGSGTVNGTSANDLLLAEDITTNLVGGDGDDCLVSGAGVNTLDGGNGNDICIGGITTVMLACETEVRT